jgi:hypothetical protein
MGKICWEIYNKNKNYIQSVTGKVITPDKFKESHPNVNEVVFLIQTDETRKIMIGEAVLLTKRYEHNIPLNLSDEEAVKMIEDLENKEAQEREESSKRYVKQQKLLTKIRLKREKIELKKAVEDGLITEEEYKDATGEEYSESEQISNILDSSNAKSVEDNNSFVEEK